MRTKSITTALFFTLSLVLTAQAVHAQGDGVRVIYDTDMGPMTDDVAALAMLHALSDKGEARILATIASNRHENVAQVLDIFNTYYGHPDIPIGVPGGVAVEIKDAPEVCCRGGWTDYLVNKYPTDVRSNDVVPTSTDVYRSVLSEQPDSSVTIITVGFLTNLSNLLTSNPDQHSDLPGDKLVEKKVRNLVSMAGTFKGSVDGSEGPRREYNLYVDALSSKHVFEEWPTEIMFSGFDFGEHVRTSYKANQANSDTRNPVKEVFHTVSSGEDGSSFDQTAVLAAVRGAEPYFDLVEGRIVVNWDGSNSWDSTGEGHSYLRLDEETLSRAEREIENLMMHESDRY
jgi:inosine-uridine nucleoside N-ribohydrolase